VILLGLGLTQIEGGESGFFLGAAWGTIVRDVFGLPFELANNTKNVHRFLFSK